MMPETVGQQLNKARTARGLTLDQVARVLHIRADFLQALEEDKRKVLPSPVHARGFLRMYAEHLGLASQPLLDLWDGKLPSQPVEISETEQAPAGEPEPEPGRVENAEFGQQIPKELADGEDASSEHGNQSEEVFEEEVFEEEVFEEEVFEEEVLAERFVENEPIATSPANPSPSRSAFIEIGDRLRKQRLALNLSVPEIERYIHVRQHYLSALEEGRIGDLPSPVQGRGMLSNYAHFLNLDVEGLLLLFAEGLQSRREERLPPSPAQKKNDPRSPVKKVPRRLLSMDLLVSIVLVMIILGFALWTAAQVDALNVDRSSPSTPPSIADVLLSNPTVTPRASTTATVPANLSTLAPGEVGSRPIAATPDVNATVPVAIGDLPLQVYVVALQRAYLRITVDNKVVFDSRVVPGNAYPFSGKEKIELLTGSAAAIQVFFNQQDLGVLGLVGQVKAYIFSSEGAVTPTPMFTATPTRTTQPTSTSQPSPTAPTATITPFVP